MPAPGTPLRSVLYCRVSTERQAEEGTSLEAQELACLRKSVDIGASVVEIVRDDGVSGALFLARPGIQRVLSILHSGAANVVIFPNLKRSGRDADVLAEIRREVYAAGADLVFSDGINFPRNAVGQFMFRVLAGGAEFERADLREKTMEGRRNRAIQSGQQPSRGFMPFGYLIVKKADLIRGTFPAEMIGRYVIIEQQAAIVRRIFDEYGRGASMRGICRGLEDDGIKTPRGYTIWRPGWVTAMLRNPVYKGEPEWGRTRSITDESRLQRGYRKIKYCVPTDPADRVQLAAPAIVSAELWDECQRRASTNRALYSASAERRYLLSGLLRCPHCGTSVAGWKGAHGYRYYVCVNAQKVRDRERTGCTFKPRPMEEVDRQVLDALIEVASRPEFVSDAIAAYDDNRQKLSDASERAAGLRAEIAALDRREAATVEAQVAGIQSGARPESYAAAFEDIRKKRGILESQLRQADTDAAKTEPVSRATEAERYGAAIRALASVLRSDKVPAAEKRTVLACVVRGIEIDGDTYSIRIHAPT